MASPFVTLIQQDAGYARTLGVARLLGQGVFLSALRDRGVDSATAARALTEFTASLPKELPDLTEAEARGFVEAVAGELNRFQDTRPGAEALDRALAAYDRQAEATGSGDAAKIVAAVGLSMTRLIGIGKLSAHIPLPRGGWVDLAPDVGPGLAPILERLADAVASVGVSTIPPTDKTDEPGPPRGGARSGHDTGRSKSSDRGARPATKRRPSGREHTEVLDHRQAIDRRDEVLHGIHTGKFLSDILRPRQDDLFVRYGGRSQADMFGYNVPGNHAQARSGVCIAAGVFANAIGNKVSWRVGLRLQSVRRMTHRALDRVREQFDAAFPGQVSVRWTGPLVCLAAQPDGRYGNWSVPIRERLAIGSPLNVAGGSIGALSLLLWDGQKYFALTAGHTIHDDDARDISGGYVYHPPQPLDCDRVCRVGVVAAVETLPPFDPLVGVVSKLQARDYALFRVMDESFLPRREYRRLVGNRLIEGSFYRLSAIGSDRPKLTKSPAKTREAIGVFVQMNVRAEILNPVTGVMVVGDDLIEMELEERFSVAPGDSGALISVDQGRTLHPFAITVAAAHKAALAKSRTRTVVYGLPLVHISGIEDKEIL